MKLNLAAAALTFITGATAFTAPRFAINKQSSSILRDTAAELDLPCEDECALTSYPNMPASVHPGVVTGQALLDLLDHAKENGKFSRICLTYVGGRSVMVASVRAASAYVSFQLLTSAYLSSGRCDTYFA